MSRLPAPLQPLWPVVKRAHRTGARVVGAVARPTVASRRPVPVDGTRSSRETVAREPETAALHPVAPAGVVRRDPPTGVPAGHWYFTERLETSVPERFVLELTDGWLLSRHAAVMSSGGLLDWETSHYFGIDDWREHPVFLNPWPRRGEQLDGTVAVLAARGTGHNYYHFVIDALPRLGMLHAAFPGLRPDRYLVDRATRYHRELLAILGLDDVPVIEPRPGLAVQARRLLVPSLPNTSTLVSPETTTWLRENLPPRKLAGRSERIYVTRGERPNTRRVLAETELRSRLERRGFVTIDPGALPVQEQIDIFAAARVVVAPHGAALTNLSFCRPGVRVLELFSPAYVNGGYWSITTNIPEARYRYLIGEGARAQSPGSAPPRYMEDISVRPEDVEAALDQLLEED